MSLQRALIRPCGRAKQEECIVLVPEDKVCGKAPRVQVSSNIPDHTAVQPVTAGANSECVDRSLGQDSVGTPNSGLLQEHRLDEVITVDSGDDKVYFVDKNEQEFVGRKSALSAISPVFQAMFSGYWREAGGRLRTSPDVCPDSFLFLLRYACGDKELKLDDDSVWNVLQVADMYQVDPLIDKCFSFLLQRHGRRGEARHLCVVLELAHRLHRPTWRDRCLQVLVTGQAAKVLSSKSCLRELCRDCMLAVVKADDLDLHDESLVLKGVWAWTQQTCTRSRKQQQQQQQGDGAGRSELRTAAGELVRHVRYACIPRRKLAALLKWDAAGPCLLTAHERRDLLERDGSLFPPTVRVPRGSSLSALDDDDDDDSDDSRPQRGPRMRTLDLGRSEGWGVRGYLCTALLAVLFVTLLFTFGFPIIPAAVIAIVYGPHNGTDLFRQKHSIQDVNSM